MNKLNDVLQQQSEVLRLKELEGYIDQSKEFKSLFSKLKRKQKQLVNAKEFGQVNQYQEYKKEYDAIFDELLAIPFMEEYLELLQIVNSDLEQITYMIEKNINKKIGG